MGSLRQKKLGSEVNLRLPVHSLRLQAEQMSCDLGELPTPKNVHYLDPNEQHPEQCCFVGVESGSFLMFYEPCPAIHCKTKRSICMTWAHSLGLFQLFLFRFTNNRIHGIPIPKRTYLPNWSQKNTFTAAGFFYRSQVTGHCFTYTESILNIHKS